MGRLEKMYELENNTIKIFSNAIKQRRAEQGITQAKLAFNAGMSQTTIARAERGYGEISLRTAIRIIHGLGQDIIMKNNK